MATIETGRVRVAVSRPDVWLIVCDQLRADALGCYGNPVAVTPAIDALAAGGTVFDSAYTPSPVCVPARASLLTGAEPHRTGCFENGWPMPDVPSFADSLAGEGYRTHAVGKMHFTPDPLAARGFAGRDVSEEFGDAVTDDYLRAVAEAGFEHVERPHGERDELYYVPQVSALPARLHHSAWVADRSTDFVDSVPADEPFLLVSSFIAPHPPFAPPAPWHRLYAPSDMPDAVVPAGTDGLLTVYQRLQNRYKYRDGGNDRRLAQAIRAFYWSSVSFLDAQIGRVVEHLRATGRWENTVVVLTADHGEFLGDYGCWGKRSFLDVAARVPLVCQGPGFDRGRSDTPVSLTDVAPTLTSHTAPDGEDLRTLAASRPRTVFGQYQQGELGMYAVIDQEWKYVWSAADRREILLDRRRDPGETRNRAYDVRVRAELLRRRAAAVSHFPDLAGADPEALSGNRPLRLGEPVSRGGAHGLELLDVDRDASTLVVTAEPHGDETFESYRRLT